MNRLQTALFLSSALVPFGTKAQAPAQPQAQNGNGEQPLNVLFIASDDLCSAMHAFGDPRVQTPNLDRLAKMGVVFNHAYCQSPLSGPSRASIMTGCRPDKTGVHDLEGRFRYAMPDAVTLPQLFKNNGYYTARVGKIFHANVPSNIGGPGADDPISWTEAFNPIGKDRTDEYKVKGNVSPGTWLDLDCTDDEMTDAISTNVAISLLRNRYMNVGSAYMGPARKNAPARHGNKQPFFMAVGYYRPHIPYIAPKKYFDLYPEVTIPERMEEEWLTKPALARSGNQWNNGVSDEECKNSVRAYYASITFIDAQIGKLIDALEEFGLMDNTIIVFWSDHGYMLGDHGMWQKQNLFEETAHQPLLIYAPKMASGTCNAIVECIDIYPTVAELAGLKTPDYIDGRSLTPLLKDINTPWNYPAYTQQARTLWNADDPMLKMYGGLAKNQDGTVSGFMFNPAVDDNHTTLWGRTVRTDRYRYTEWDEGREGYELYDYQTDPEEHVNLAVGKDAKKYKKLLAEMAELLHKGYNVEEIKATQATIRKNREAANAALEQLKPLVTY